MTETHDVLVSGAGAAGLAAAISLARSGLSVVCAGKSDTRPNGRTVALFEGSLRFLRAQRAWEPLQECGQPISAIRIIDDTGARWTVPPLTLRASEIGLEALGCNIENDRLVGGLLAQAEVQPRLELTGAHLEKIEFAEEHVTAHDASGRTIRARLLVAADGRKSPARQASGIGSRTWSDKQVALTSLLAHEKPHHAMSTEFHTREGPCTLVPLQPTANAPHRSSLVWLMSPGEAERRRSLAPDALAEELRQQTRNLVGRCQFEDARGSFPMGGLKVNRLAAHRIVLIGEAAHAFPPLAAQGLNLSLRDVAQLVATLGPAARAQEDVGAKPLLQRYERARRRDIAVRTNGVDILNRSIMTDFAPVDVARGLGALALRAIAPMRRAVLREGILPAMPGL